MLICDGYALKKTFFPQVHVFHSYMWICQTLPLFMMQAFIALIRQSYFPPDIVDTN